MNAREGMRRIGIVLGVLGGIIAGGIGYSDLQNVWSSHTRFRRLQALAVMHDVATAIKAYQSDWFAQNAPKPAPPATLPADFFDEQQALAARKPQDQNKVYLDDQGKPIASGKAQHEGASGWVPVPDFIPDSPAARKADVADKIADPAAEITVDVNDLEGIKTVNADKAGAISSIRLTTGEWVHREPEAFKARLAFVARLLLALSYPVIGFLVPWGAIRVLIWVGSGFLAPPSSA